MLAKPADVATMCITNQNKPGEPPVHAVEHGLLLLVHGVGVGTGGGWPG